MTPGGNPVFRCSLCGVSCAAISPHELCWCSYAHRNQTDGAFMCLAYSEIERYPALLELFRSCGCEPTRRGAGEIGIVAVAGYRAVSYTHLRAHET